MRLQQSLLLIALAAAAVSCEAFRDRAAVLALKAGGATSVRIAEDGTVHARDPRGREIWMTREDLRARRFRMRSRAGVSLMIMKDADVPSSVPPDVTMMMAAGRGLEYRPPWLTPYPGGTAEPQFAVIESHRVSGSWTFETADDTSAVRMQLVEQLVAAGLTQRPGVAQRPARDLPIVIDAGQRGVDRYVQIHVGPGPRDGAHGEVFYEYRR